ncbi:MAG: hypothetical protein GXO19_03110 [Epsilonproteobacteria bacterium]|nr:hypothetical protein [Campylobacterota bacterium]NPA56710.1 hypothetical protein [Campylobacterota bacterium]
MPSQQVDLVVVALSPPLLVGIYREGRLVEKREVEGKLSEVLPELFREIMDRFEIKRIFFARGPGSFMSIKLLYLFLKTLQITKGVELYGCDGFTFNQNRPIKAVGKLYFVREGGIIVTKRIEGEVEQGFQLPEELDSLRCSRDETAPLYVIPAV